MGGSLSAGSVGWSQARDVTIAPGGVLLGDAATLEVTGDWDNGGTFVPGASTVQLVDGCGVLSSVVSGDTTFTNIAITSASGRLVSFVAGTTQTVTGAFLAEGEEGALLQIRSTVADSAAFLVALGPASASFVDVMDNDASGGNEVPLGVGSTKVSNTPSWILASLVPLSSPWARTSRPCSWPSSRCGARLASSP